LLSAFTIDKPLARAIRSQGLHDARFPELKQVNFSVQFQPRDSWLIETSFSGAYGSDLASIFVNMNQVPFEYALDGRAVQRLRPFPNVNGSVIPSFSNASNNYNAFNLRVEKRYSHGLNFLMNYTSRRTSRKAAPAPAPTRKMVVPVFRSTPTAFRARKVRRPSTCRRSS
jgi:hypothetical protein